jgi:hypothetical protein
MKKILISAIISMFSVMTPFASFAKTAISEGEMDAVIAQTGITLDFSSDGITIQNFAPSTISWGDADGFPGYPAAGYFGMKDISMSIDYISIHDLMTINVGTSAGVTKLNIGLPVVRLFTLGVDATIKLDDTDKTLMGVQPALGTFYNNVFYAMLNGTGNNLSQGGSIEISSHSTTQGMEIGFNNVVLNVPAVGVNMSWGDGDGFGTTYTSAGYFGLHDLQIGPGSGLTDWNPLITLSGVMDIDIGTNASDVTALNVSLPAIKIGTMDIDTQLALSANKNFSDAQPPLGYLSMRGFSTTVSGGMAVSSH